MSQKTCCFTGHRKIPNSQYKNIKKRLTVEIIKLIENGVVYFGTGGALGFDTLAALVVISLKTYYPKIKLILVLPCKSQSKYWSENDISIYENIKSYADKIVYVSKDYTADCMYKRNRHLVDYSDYCICYLRETSGGTAYTVKYAITKGISTIHI